jgi:hypothetical protein
VDEPAVVPRNELERVLACIWCEVLDLERVGVFDDFYEVGGHSLLAMGLSSQVMSQLHVEFRVRDVERWPTIASQAEAITSVLTGHDGIGGQPAAQGESFGARRPADREVR